MIPVRQDRKVKGIAAGFVLAAITLFIGCTATVPTVRDKLDLTTGVTVMFNSTPLVMFRENPAQAAFARSVIHLGPIQVNRSGDYRFYLWISAWTTMQSPGPLEHQDSLESIVIFADGEPLSLELAGWTPEAIGVSEPVYLKPVASSVDAYYRVTADQIRLMAEAHEIRLRTAGAHSREFAPWDDQIVARSELLEFLNRTFF